MSATVYKSVRNGAIAAGALLVVLLALVTYFALAFVDASTWVEHTSQVISEIRGTRLLVGVPGSRTDYGAARQVRIDSVLEQLHRVADLTVDNPRQQASTREFQTLYSQNPPEISTSSLTEFDSQRVIAANAMLDHMQGEEIRLLGERTKRQSESTRQAAYAISALCLALTFLGTLTAVGGRNEFRRRAQAEATLELEKAELTSYTRELALVSAGSELIQAAVSEEQLSAAVCSVLSDLVPGSHGYFGLVSPSKDLVEISATWGKGETPTSFSPLECVALQLGRPVHRSQSLLQVTCKHSPVTSQDYVCVPLRSASGHLGVLHVEVQQQLSKKLADAVSLFAGHVALGLTNLRMVEVFRNQSVRDSLTGLFNRRYFDETLQRELLGAVRQSQLVSVLMLDLDKFKNCNDTFGHAAGDDVLRGFGRLMRASFRESDVVCRYGGEEFAVIMVGASLEEAFAKAELFRDAVEGAQLCGEGRSMGRMTTSIGVACSDEFTNPHSLVAGADAALYQAKRDGRNRTWTCSNNPGALPAIPVPASPHEPTQLRGADPLMDSLLADPATGLTQAASAGFVVPAAIGNATRLV